MSTPKRIQRKRTKGWRMPDGAVYVGRPTRWGNPFHAVQAPAWPGPAGSGPWYVMDSLGMRWHAEQDGKRAALERAVELFETHAQTQWDDRFRARVVNDLAGRDLACWCALDQPCHADVLLEIANGDQP